MIERPLGTILFRLILINFKAFGKLRGFKELNDLIRLILQSL